MVHENAEHGTPHVPQYRRTREERRRFVFAVFMDFRTLRPAPELGRCGAHKDLWGGKLIIKGIMEPEDAEKAAKAARTH